MKSTTWIGIILVLLGALALAYQGISYTRTEKVLDSGPLQASAQMQEWIPVPPILGGIAVAAGVVLLVVGARRKAPGVGPILQKKANREVPRSGGRY